MNNKIFTTFGLLAGLIIIIVAVVAAVIYPDSFKKPYSAISTPSGFYVGKIYSAPYSAFIELRDGYILENSQGAKGETSSRLLPLRTTTIWGAKSFSIAKSQILFKGAVDSCSDVGKALGIDKDCVVAAAPTPEAMVESDK